MSDPGSTPLDTPRPRRTRWVGLAAIVAIVATGVLLRSYALRAPVAGDDFIQYAMLEGEYPVHRNPLDLFRFASGTPADNNPLMDRGLLPWWTVPGFRLAMFRPLSSLLVALDFALFRHGARGPHAHSLAWLAAMLFAAAALYRRALSGAPRLALLALALLAVDESLTVPVVWLANRNALVAVTFGALAVFAHVRAREHAAARPARDATLSALCAFLALAAGEYALTVLVYIPAYELFVPRGESVRRRLLALVPLAALAATYAVVSSALGYGARGSAAYLDPLRTPGAYLHALGERFPALLAHLIVGRPVEGTPESWTRLGSAARLALVGLALVGLPLAGALRRLPDAGLRRRVYWLATGALVGLVPLCAAAPSERLLAGPALGTAGVLAVLVGEAFELVRPVRARGRAFWLRAPLCLALAVMHLPLAALASAGHTRRVTDALAAETRALRESTIDPRGLADAVVILLAAVDPETLHYPPYIWHWEGYPMPRAFRVLSMGPGPHIVHRPAPDTLDVLAAAPMFANGAAFMLRPVEPPLPAGTVVRLEGFTVYTADSTPLGPRAARFVFDRSLDEPSVRLYIATAHSLLPLPMPRVGGGGPVPPPAQPLRSEP